MKRIIDLSSPITKADLLKNYQPSIKRSIKISKSKLPDDFFIKQPLPSLKSSSSFLSRKNILTQKINRARMIQKNEENQIDNCRKKAMTSRTNRIENQENNLIQGVISLSKEMKKMIRKHSIQFRKLSIQKQNKMMTLFSQKNPQKEEIFLSKDFRIQKFANNKLKTE